MENEKLDLYDLIEKGGVYSDIGGQDIEEIFENICNTVKFPQGVDKNLVYSELLEREKILSTAVGEGFAIPHPRKQVVTDDKNQCLFICYLDNEIDMHAPDSRNVKVMFVLLNTTDKNHLQALSDLANLIRNPEIKQALENKAPKEEILNIIKKNR